MKSKRTNERKFLPLPTHCYAQAIIVYPKPGIFWKNFKKCGSTYIEIPESPLYSLLFTRNKKKKIICEGKKKYVLNKFEGPQLSPQVEISEDI